MQTCAAEDPNAYTQQGCMPGSIFVDKLTRRPKPTLLDAGRAPWCLSSTRPISYLLQSVMHLNDHEALLASLYVWLQCHVMSKEAGARGQCNKMLSACSPVSVEHYSQSQLQRSPVRAPAWRYLP